MSPTAKFALVAVVVLFAAPGVALAQAPTGWQGSVSTSYSYQFGVYTHTESMTGTVPGSPVTEWPAVNGAANVHWTGYDGDNCADDQLVHAGTPLIGGYANGAPQPARIYVRVARQGTLVAVDLIVSLSTSGGTSFGGERNENGDCVNYSRPADHTALHDFRTNQGYPLAADGTFDDTFNTTDLTVHTSGRLWRAQDGRDHFTFEQTQTTPESSAHWSLELSCTPSICLSGPPQCSDAQNNDFDGLVDYPSDPGCLSPNDPSELGAVQCDNGLDDDSDGNTDWPSDKPGCEDASDDSEAEWECSDGKDNDGDLRVDFAGSSPPGGVGPQGPSDPGCDSAQDNSEAPDPACGDRVDNDEDGLVDLADPGCTDARDTSEYDEVTVTVDIDGPGSVNGCAERICTFQVERGAHMTLVPQERTPDGFWGFEGCPTQPAGGDAPCSFKVTQNTTMTAEFDPVAGYAPRITLYPGHSNGEKAWPDDPGEFFKRSRLMWFNGSKGVERCGWDSTARVKVAGKPDASKIRAGGYKRRQKCWATGYVSNGTYREHGPKTFTSKGLTAPAADGERRKRIPGRLGFYLDIPDTSRTGVKPADSGYSNAPPLYYEYAEARYVTYWFFTSFNHRRGDTHEGDWEHLVVRLDDDWRPTDAAYYNHLCDPIIHSWSKLERQGWIDDDHPHAYIARGGHGAYPDAGKTLWTCWQGWKPIPPAKLFKGVYDVRGDGANWRPWLTRSGLKNAASQSWYGLGVGWGTEGGIGWGPVGPGSHKSGVVPPGWRR